jgi:2-oxoglutarate ferredoxin oxidoreductase subunit alpha
MTAQTQDRLVRRLVDKLQPVADELALFDAQDLDGAAVVVVSYGITSRVAQRAIALARARGVRAGSFRLITAWPFPENALRALARKIKAFVVPELNLGQMVREVERVAGGTPTVSVTHAGGGVHRPEQILDAIMEAAQ